MVNVIALNAKRSLTSVISYFVTFFLNQWAVFISPFTPSLVAVYSEPGRVSHSFLSALIHVRLPRCVIALQCGWV